MRKIEMGGMQSLWDDKPQYLIAAVVLENTVAMSTPNA
jgi:hypothetical protein